MRNKYPPIVEEGRFTDESPWSSKPGDPSGAFLIKGPCGETLKIIASDGNDRAARGWEHVSVSTRSRVPNWEEMCFVKELFWTDDEWVVQFHPARKDYVNYHPFCLHLWRQRKGFPTPQSILVGPKT